MKNKIILLLLALILITVPVHATVSSEDVKTSANCDGVTSAFVYNFRILQDADMSVVIDTSGVQTDLVLNSDYTIANATYPAIGGTVTLDDPATSCITGNTIHLLRAQDYLQGTQIGSGIFPNTTHEDMVDELTMSDQQLKDASERSVKVNSSSSITESALTLSPSADKAICWDGAGTALTNCATSANTATNNFKTLATDYNSSLATMVTDIGASDTTVFVDVANTVLANLVIPSNIHIIYLKNGLTTGASGISLTINGQFEAGLFRTFSGFDSGDVTFGEDSIIEAYPEWWTFNTTPGTTDMTIAIQSALDATKGTPTTGIVKLAHTSYAITSITMYEGSMLFGSDWMFNGNVPFGNAAWTASNYFGTFLIASGASNAIEFDSATPSFTKPKIKDLALVGPGSGSTVGINAVIAGGGINNAHRFLDNVLVGNFSIGVDMESFTTGSIYDIVIKGNETGWRWGNNSNNNNDIKVYNMDVQQNEIGLEFITTALTSFYGGLIQGNKTGSAMGIKFANTVSGNISNLNFNGIWFEDNTVDWDTDSGTGTVLSKISFSNSQTSSSAWTWNPLNGQVFSRIKFDNCSFASISLDFSNFATGGLNKFTILNSEFGTITYGDPLRVHELDFKNTRDTTGITLHSSLRSDVVEISSAEILALTTPKPLVGSQAADTVIEFVSAMIIYDYGTAAYVEPSAPDDMIIEYNDGTDITAAIDATNFIDQANDEIRLITPTLAITTDLISTKFKNIQLTNTGANYTTGDGTMRIKINYIVHQLGL